MTAFDYAATAATARRLIARFGQTLQLRRLSGGTYSPVTGATTGSVTTTDTDVLAVAVNLDAAYRAEVGNENVQADDRLFLVEAAAAPLLTDSLVIDSVPWSIVRINPIAPASVAVVYQVQVRR